MNHLSQYIGIFHILDLDLKLFTIKTIFTEVVVMYSCHDVDRLFGLVMMKKNSL